MFTIKVFMSSKAFFFFFTNPVYIIYRCTSIQTSGQEDQREPVNI